MKPSSIKYVKIFLFVFFVLVAVFVWERNYYNVVLIEKGFEAYPSSQSREGVYIQNLTYVVDQYDQKLDVMKLMPGDSFDGALFVKNSFLEEKKVTFVLFNDFSEKNENRIEFIVEQNNFILRPGEWRYVKYQIRVPENYEQGSYLGKVAARTDDVILYKNFDVVLAIAVQFNIDVVDKMFESYTRNIVSFDLTPEDIAMRYVYSDLKRLSGYGFGFLAILFLYQALKYDSKKKK